MLSANCVGVLPAAAATLLVIGEAALAAVLILAVAPQNLAAGIPSFFAQTIPAELPGHLLALHALRLWFWYPSAWPAPPALGGWDGETAAFALAWAARAGAALSTLALLYLLRLQWHARAIFRAALTSTGVVVSTPALDARLSAGEVRAILLPDPFPSPASVGLRKVTLEYAVGVPSREGPPPPARWSHISPSREAAFATIFRSLAAIGAKIFHAPVATLTDIGERGAGPVVAEGEGGLHLPSLPRESSTQSLRLDIYTRRGALRTDRHGRAPVFVYVHGGGWVIGKKHLASIPLLQGLALRGFLVISVSYRLSPSVAFPAHLHDIKRALAWVAAHAAEHGGDAGSVLLGGDSAGGHLALMSALTQGVQELDPPALAGGPLVLPSPHPPIAGVVALYPVVDWLDHGGHWARRWLDTGGQGVLLERYVLQLSRSERPWAWVEASPLWWMHGSRMESTLAAAGVALPGLAQQGQAEDAEAPSPRFRSRSRPNRVPPLSRGHPSRLLPALVQDRPLPPILLVHGSVDTLVPASESAALWAALSARREREGGRSGDVYVDLPGGHHAFNYMPSGRTHALTAAVADWADAVLAGEKGA
jgi:acetyl esterase/lipase